VPFGASAGAVRSWNTIAAAAAPRSSAFSALSDLAGSATAFRTRSAAVTAALYSFAVSGIGGVGYGMAWNGSAWCLTRKNSHRCPALSSGLFGPRPERMPAATAASWVTNPTLRWVAPAAPARSVSTFTTAIWCATLVVAPAYSGVLTESFSTAVTVPTTTTDDRSARSAGDSIGPTRSARAGIATATRATRAKKTRDMGRSARGEGYLSAFRGTDLLIR
jgi:hypothetical protein